MTEAEIWERLRAARVGVLATNRSDGPPHLVPFVFSVVADATLVSAVDEKPKRDRRLARLANIDRDPRVAVLVQHYDEDWSELWWVRAEGSATVRDRVPDEWERRLVGEYPDYEDQRLGPFVVIRVDDVAGWSAAGR